VRLLVGVVLDGKQVVAEPVGQTRCLQDAGGVAGVRYQEVSELERMAVIHG
jgi:hypothetical protein